MKLRFRSAALGLTLVLLVSSPPARAEGEPELARRFAEAFRQRDEAKMAVLAARPLRKVSYALVCDRLIRPPNDATLAAAKLAALRKGAPDGPGLARLVKAAQNRVFASPQQVKEMARIRGLLGQNKNREALDALLPQWEPPPGTLDHASFAQLRAAALTRLGAQRPDRAWGEAAARAEAVGWLNQAYELRKHQVAAARRVARKTSMLEAASHQVRLATALDDAKRKLASHLQRARMHRDAGDAAKMRVDYGGARQAALARIESAGAKEQRELKKLAAQMAGRLALSFHRGREPRRALKNYEIAVKELLALGLRKEADAAQFNSVLVLVDLARYGQALDLLDSLAGSEGSASLKPRILAERARILRRQGRLVSALGAYDKAIAAAPGKKERAPLWLGVGELHLRRWELTAAEEAFRQAEAAHALQPGVLTGLATVAELRGDEARARELLQKERLRYKTARRPAAEGLALLRLAELERHAGRLGAARVLAVEARRKLLEANDRGNIGSVDVFLARLYIAAAQYEDAVESSERASSIFKFSRLAEFAGKTMIRHGLLMRSIRRGVDAHAVLGPEAEITAVVAAAKDPALEATLLCARALLAHDRKEPGAAIPLLDKAQGLAEKAGDLGRRALVHRTRAKIATDPETIWREATEAIRLLEARRADPEDPTESLPDETPADAHSLALAGLLGRDGLDAAQRARLAFEVMERKRLWQLQAIFGGRERMIAILCPEGALKRAYLEARAELFQARALGRPTAALEQARDKALSRLRENPAHRRPFFLAAPTDLADVQRVLKKGELLLLAVADVHVQAVVAISPDGATVSRFDSGDPLKGLGSRLNKAERLLVSPEFALLDTPLRAQAFGGAPVLERWQISIVPSAAFLVRERGIPPGRGRRLVPRDPQREPLPPLRSWKGQGPWPSGAHAILRLAFGAELNLATPRDTRLRGDTEAYGLIRLIRQPGRAELLWIPRSTLRNRIFGRTAGLGALIEACAQAGSPRLVLNLGSEDVSDLWRGFREARLEKRLRPLRAWTRALRRRLGSKGASGANKPPSVVFCGLPE